MRAMEPPVSSPKRVLTNPGCRLFVVTPVPASRRASTRVNKILHNFERAISRKRFVVVLGLQIVEIDLGAIVSMRRSIDDPRGARSRSAALASRLVSTKYEI